MLLLPPLEPSVPESDVAVAEAADSVDSPVVAD
jgi:hypothetical protein